MSDRNVYVIQPYQVGHKGSKSLAMIIPAKVARDLKLNNNSVLILRPNENKITLQRIKNFDGPDNNSTARKNSIKTDDKESPKEEI